MILLAIGHLGAAAYDISMTFGALVIFLDGCIVWVISLLEHGNGGRKRGRGFSTACLFRTQPYYLVSGGRYRDSSARYRSAPGPQHGRQQVKGNRYPEQVIEAQHERKVFAQT